MPGMKPCQCRGLSDPECPGGAAGPARAAVYCHPPEPVGGSVRPHRPFVQPPEGRAHPGPLRLHGRVRPEPGRPVNHSEDPPLRSGYFQRKYVFLCNSEKSTDFSELLFHGKGTPSVCFAAVTEGVSTAFSTAFAPKIFKSLFKIKKLRYSILICILKEKERCTLWCNISQNASGVLC